MGTTPPPSHSDPLCIQLYSTIVCGLNNLARLTKSSVKIQSRLSNIKFTGVNFNILSPHP